MDINEDVAENDGDKIPNLYERVLMNKNNLKYKELINEVTEKKNLKEVKCKMTMIYQIS